MNKPYKIIRYACYVSCFIFALITFSTRSVRAETIIVSDTIPSRVTNWHDTLTIPAFPPKYGQLTGISITLETPIFGSVSYENTSEETATITSTHAVSMSMELPDGSLLESFPAKVRVDEVMPFDGVSDFDGESGASFTMDTTLSVTRHFTGTEILNYFYGDQFLRFPITATGSSFIFGPGNYDAILRAQAAGVTLLIYFDYLPIDIEIQKLTNGHDADSRNGMDLPLIFPGAPITWTYLVTNSGMLTLTADEIVVTDSDPSVTPYLDISSDDGDGLLSPGETWHYLATGTALNLQTSSTSHMTVDGCQNRTDVTTSIAYENIGAVTALENTASDPSHYCNPTTRTFAPGIAINKFTNGADADMPNGIDVPFLFPGDPVNWTYLVTNTGDISFTFTQVKVIDDDPTVTITFDLSSDVGNDMMLAPGEQWRYIATGKAENLSINNSTITMVAGCNPGSTTSNDMAYRNVATVTINTLTASDPSHYCNFPPTAVQENNRERNHQPSIYLPMIQR